VGHGAPPATRSGKLSPADLERLVLPHLGASRPEVLAGPRPGADAAIVRLSAGRVMAITTDPLSLVPALGVADSARLGCHLLASDLWTSGIPPAYASVTLNLPPTLDDATLEAYASAMGETWRELGVAVVTGHTGRYSGCDLTIVGACTLVGVGDEGRTVGPGFVAVGDRVIVTKDCAVEATAIAARLFPARLGATLDEDGMARARAKLADASVVRDCRAALAVGVRDRGVSALHDATEGGVLGGLVELARAAEVDLRVIRARIPLSDEAREACASFEIDPYWTLSEGTLIATVRPAYATQVLEALAAEGIVAAEVGEVLRGKGVVWLSEPDGSVLSLAEAKADPYWDAYDRAVREGWR
jgi:hydrogenase maturation factor